MRVEFYEPAAEHERYALHAFDRVIGQEVPFKIAGAERGRATVISVVVDDDGRGATWTMDLDAAASQVAGRFTGIRGPLTGFTGDQCPSFSFSVPEIPERWWEP